MKDGSHVVIWTACKITHNQYETSCEFRPHPRKCLYASGSISIWSDYQYQYLVTTQFYDMYGRNAILRHALVGTQLHDMPWLGRSSTTCPGWDAVYDMPWSGRSFTTCPSLDAGLRHVLVYTQFHEMPWSGHSLTICPGWDAILRPTRVGTQFYNMPWVGRS